MNADLGSLTALLAFFWFLVYWIFGGVLFALLALFRLGRIRKVRFSCLFTMLALASGIGAAWRGIAFSRAAVEECLTDAQNKAEIITSIFGCGFVGIFGAFGIGILVLLAGGWILMAISTSQSKPWISLEENKEEEPHHVDKGSFFS